MHDITLSFLNEEKKIKKKSIDEENLALFHCLITGSKLILENLRFNEFETVKIIKPRLYLDFDTRENKKAVK